MLLCVATVYWLLEARLVPTHFNSMCRYFMKIFRDVAQQQGDHFVLRDFVDSFLNVGMIPMSLTRWELTGLEDEMKILGLLGEDAAADVAVTPAAGTSRL